MCGRCCQCTANVLSVFNFLSYQTKLKLPLSVSLSLRVFSASGTSYAHVTWKCQWIKMPLGAALDQWLIGIGKYIPRPHASELTQLCALNGVL